MIKSELQNKRKNKRNNKRDWIVTGRLKEEHMQNIKLGFIGFGNMAQAMVKGLLLKEVLPADQIYACAKNWEMYSFR